MGRVLVKANLTRSIPIRDSPLLASMCAAGWAEELEMHTTNKQATNKNLPTWFPAGALASPGEFGNAPFMMYNIASAQVQMPLANRNLWSATSSAVGLCPAWLLSGTGSNSNFDCKSTKKIFFIWAV